MQWQVPQAAGRGLRHALPVVGLLAAVWLAYFPSLGHGPRADQWCFLLDTVGQEHFSSLFAHTYSYNRTRVVAPGDYPLFRPVLFALLSGEKALFGNDFELWQATGVWLHCLALYLLLHLMWRIHERTAGEVPPDPGQPGLSARKKARAVCFALVLFFGLNCSVVEMVIWTHINGYILFVIWVLGSQLLLLEGLCERDLSGGKRMLLVGGAWLLILLSAFTYEIGQFYAVVVGVVVGAALYRKGKARRSAAVFVAFLGILVIYQAANQLDQLAHPRPNTELPASAFFERLASGATLIHATRYVMYTAVQPFFPSWTEGWSFTGRLFIPEGAPAHWRDWRIDPSLLLSCAVLAGVAGLTLIGLRRLPAAARKRVAVAAVLLAASLFTLHMGITVAGRMNMRPAPDMLANNSYYPYIPLLFLCLALSSLWAFVASSPAAPVRDNALFVLVFAGLLVLSAVSGIRVHSINVKGEEEFADFTRHIGWIERFIRQHRDEPDFSLAFDRDSCKALDARFDLGGQSAGTHYGVPITTILFEPYLNPSHPQYVICFPNGEPSPATFAEWRARRNPSLHLCPELVLIESSYLYYRVDGRYYGVLHWDGCYDPLRRDHAYLIEGATLEEARDKQAARIAEQDADIRQGRFLPPGIPVTLLQEGYKGFNLIGAGSKVYAIPQGEGGFEPARVRDRGYSRCYTGDSIAEVREQIDSSGDFIPAGTSITLLVEGYKGFNLIGFAGKVYAIPQGEGAFEVGKVRDHGYSRSFEGGRIAEVKAHIDAAGSPGK